MNSRRVRGRRWWPLIRCVFSVFLSADPSSLIPSQRQKNISASPPASALTSPFTRNGRATRTSPRAAVHMDHPFAL
ncbi:hypothetical protein C8F01DRAFT_1159905 [Mycena amicta]|nr:hypothetical protein C8F01DRAFT_1159905 [Mycena amicta]